MLKKVSKIPVTARYIILILVAAIAVFAVIKLKSIYANYMWGQHVSEEAEKKLKGEVELIQKNILSFEQIPANLGYVLEFSNPTREDIEVLLRSIIENTPEAFGVSVAFEPYKYDKDTIYYAPYLYRKDGNIISVDPTDTTYKYFSLDWYLIPKTLNKPVWIEPYYDEGSSGGNIVLTTYAVPFYKFDGIKETMGGIIAVDISVDWLSKVVSSLKLTADSYSILVSENGTIIGAPNPAWPYNESIFSIADEENIPALREAGRNLQQGKSGFINIGKFGTKKNWWVYYMPIPSNHWGVLLLVPEE